MTPSAGPIYVDTSALIKLYLPEPGSDELNRLLDGRRDLLLAELTVTEFVSAMARRKRDRDLTARVAGRLYKTLLDHAHSRFLLIGATPDTHRSAERLLLSQEGVALRAADALHLALALAGEARAVATYDGRLARAGSELGMEVLPTLPAK